MVHDEIVFESKSELRKYMKLMRASLSYEDRLYYSRCISETLFNTDGYKNSSTILAYISYGTEVNTAFIIDRALQDNKKVAVPKVIDNQTILFYYISSRNELTEGAYGILEPADNNPVCTVTSENTLMIMPGLAFDMNKYRLGYGKGYYDRFISRYKGYTVGVCYSEFMTDDIPVDEYDRCVDIVITEKQKGNDDGE